MRILLDTQAWLWWLAEPSRLGPEALVRLKDRRNTLFLSAASAWEIAIKVRLGRLRLPAAPERFVPARMKRDGVVGLPVEHTHALRVARLPLHHRDPFDRLLIAQAQVEGLPILTSDPELGRYDVEILRAE